MAGPSMRPDRRGSAHRNALYELSVLCSQSGQGGVATEAIELLLAALGLDHGALFDVEGGDLRLVSQWGMPAKLREGAESVPVTERSWFPAGRAAASRKLVCARPGIGGPVLPEAMVMAGWGVTCAVPLLMGRRAIGVMTFGSDTDKPFDEETRTFLQTAAGMLALTFALRQERERARDATEGVAWRKGAGARGRAAAKEKAVESQRALDDKRTAATQPPPAASSAAKPPSSRSGANKASKRRGAVPAAPVGDAQDRKITVRNLRVGRGPNATTVPEMPAVDPGSPDDKDTVPPRRRASRRPPAKRTAADDPANKRQMTTPPSGRAAAGLPVVKKPRDSAATKRTQELPASKKKS